MPINIMWKNDAKREIVLKLIGLWSLQEFYDSNQRAHDYIGEVDYSVPIILDVQDSKNLPEGFMNAITNISRKSPANMGILVMVGVNTFARTFIRLYRKVYPRKPGEKIIYYAGNMDEAQAIIDGIKAAKPEVPVPY